MSSTYSEPSAGGTAKPDRVGQRVGSYRLEKLLGEGGMGQVYVAADEKIGGLIAVKVLSPRYCRELSWRSRFEDEARAAVRVRHPGLVIVFGVNQLSDGTPCILMELLEGASLRSRMSRERTGRADLVWCVRVVQQLADALAKAHAAHLVHCDVKPENVMILTDSAVDGGERAKLLDFGIAKLTSDATSSARGLQAVYGTPAYMSPEQCTRRRVDEKTDVYSLGCVLYELLCGSPPYVAPHQWPRHKQAEHLRRCHAYGTPPPAQSSRPALPKPLNDLLGQMLRREASSRPSMQEVAGRCQQFLASHRPGASFAFHLGMLLLLILLVSIAISVLFRPWETPGPTDPTTDDMHLFPATEFLQGSTPAEVKSSHNLALHQLGCPACTLSLYERELPARSVQLSSFFLDRFEITNQQFSAWLLSQGFGLEHQDILVEDRTQRGTTHNPGDSVQRRSVTVIKVAGERVAVIDSENRELRGIFGLQIDGNDLRVIASMEKKPVVNVTFMGAYLYCSAQGKRLPTEAEWEFAARGPERRLFPWGNSLPDPGDPALGWMWLRRGVLYDVGTTPKDRTREGIYDLGGNVSEWTQDYFLASYASCAGCKNPIQQAPPASSGENLRVVRGGSWHKESDAARGAGRSRWFAKESTGDIGFRCARDANPRLSSSPFMP